MTLQGFMGSIEVHIERFHSSLRSSSWIAKFTRESLIHGRLITLNAEGEAMFRRWEIKGLRWRVKVLRWQEALNIYMCRPRKGLNIDEDGRFMAIPLTLKEMEL
ncbi:unnamed protein product [Somion occarium]|uniref:Uncharacterized protein n=1 Tax=Somion occarium TaxID=3059160 RepID=A0ABP1CUW2_9APHY